MKGLEKKTIMLARKYEKNEFYLCAAHKYDQAGKYKKAGMCFGKKEKYAGMEEMFKKAELGITEILHLKSKIYFENKNYWLAAASLKEISTISSLLKAKKIYQDKLQLNMADECQEKINQIIYISNNNFFSQFHKKLIS